MPSHHVGPPQHEPNLCTVKKNGVEKTAHVMGRRDGEFYVHYVNTDKRLDEWIPEENCRLLHPSASREGSSEPQSATRKRKRSGTSTGPHSPMDSPAELEQDHIALATDGVEEANMTEEDYDIQHHKKLTATKNWELVYFAEWEIKPWYFSPYPLLESESEDSAASQSSTVHTTQAPRVPGVPRATARSHRRVADVLATGLGRSERERATLWVCDNCFKYMADGKSYDLHRKICDMRHPPGRRVFHRGAHSIWEVDGAKEKLYCQNLALFGKLFIDVKTLFFDCDNFLFYILTDANSTHDRMMGFFSKEKVSYDDYNLACIMILPPYQRSGYGMLLIEFSYELSRRSGKVGTPERPLSDLGLRSYTAYWVATLVRFFKRVLSALPPEEHKATTLGSFPDLLRSPSHDSEENGTPFGSANGEINGSANGTANGTSMPPPSVNGAESSSPRKRKRAKGFDGEYNADIAVTPYGIITDPKFTTQRIFETVSLDDGSAVTHVSVRCTLADIARATNLRIEDAAFALNECGLLTKRLNGTGFEENTILVTRELVDKVAKERDVKKPCMQLQYVRL